MSYLNVPRLHFAGRFQASPSTVNNDPLHYNNATFQANYQLPGRGTSNGWWNPGGNAAWRLIGCRVTSAWLGYEQEVTANDAVLQCLVGDSDRAPLAKIVDLDPEQQMVSEIWGLEVRICLADGTNILRGRFETAAFADIWDRAASGGGDIGGGAMYQSVLTDLEWGDVSASAFLGELQRASRDGLLSIKFNVDGYNMDSTSPEFTRGRVVGTIGPASAKEPKHFVVGRHFMAAPGPNPNFFAPVGQVNFCVAVVDATAGKVVIDLGNALPSASPGGPLVDLGTLAVAYLAPPTSRAGGSPAVILDELGYDAGTWYQRTAGIAALPAGRKLSHAELAAIGQSQLAITLTGADGSTRVAVAEAPSGAHVRADDFVFRLNPADGAKPRLFASKWGRPYAEARIVAYLDPLQLQPAGVEVGVPTSAVDFPARVVTDRSGIAELPVSTTDPGLVRSFIDGQVYGLRTMLEDNLAVGSGYNANPCEFISFLVWSGFVPDDPPTWHGSIEPIFRQYANLYPVMKPIVDLADYDSVCKNTAMLAFAFALPDANPNAMPVTRDLSKAKRAAILRWLSEPGSDGNPLKGSAPASQAARPSVSPSLALPAFDGPSRGGKAEAASRRAVFRRRSPGSPA